MAWHDSSRWSKERLFNTDILPFLSPCIAFSIITNKEVSVSRHPVFPQLQIFSLSLNTGIWLNSPAKPLCPRNNSPSRIIPRPTPHPILMTITFLWLRAVPNFISASPIRLESLSIKTGRSISSRIKLIMFVSPELRNIWLIPFFTSIKPGILIPIPRHFSMGIPAWEINCTRFVLNCLRE